MQKILIRFTWFIVLLLVVDMLGFMLWIASGQIPVDSFHIGIITESIIKIII